MHPLALLLPLLLPLLLLLLPLLLLLMVVVMVLMLVPPRVCAWACHHAVTRRAVAWQMEMQVAKQEVWQQHRTTRLVLHCADGAGCPES
jgi:hypothetical protein